MHKESNKRLFVITRSGREEEVDYSQIQKRIQKFSQDLEGVDSAAITRAVIVEMTNKMTTSAIEDLAASICEVMGIPQIACSYGTTHQDYATLASRLYVANLQKSTPGTLLECAHVLHKGNKMVKLEGGKKITTFKPLISDEVYDFIVKNADALQSAIDYKRDFDFDSFGFKTLISGGYLQKVDGKVVERPQHMWMRTACDKHCGNLPLVLKTYEYLSKGYYIHGSPGEINAALPDGKNQLSSCFLITMQDDSMEGIYETLKQCALLSKSGGGIGVNISNIRSSGMPIYGTNGRSKGLVPMLRVFNETARYADQGGGKRKGAFAIYIEPWHPDFMDILHSKDEFMVEQMRLQDLHFRVWMPDLLMERAQQGGHWSFFDPTQGNLYDLYGEEFKKNYLQLEREGLARKTLPAREVLKEISLALIRTGGPSVMFKDACNIKSNQKNLGTIRGSNLCCEIVEFSSAEEIAVCNLASISLPKMLSILDSSSSGDDGVGGGGGGLSNSRGGAGGCLVFDFERLYDVTYHAAITCSKVIDVGSYPVAQCRQSNWRHRPIGLGVQGMADVFALLRIAFDSEEARFLNLAIHEVMYYAAMTASVDLAQKGERKYASFEGSPLSQGLFQFDMWDTAGASPGATPDIIRSRIANARNRLHSQCKWINWNKLRKRVKREGAGLSLMIAPMPTASTSQILGNNECFEPFTSNISTRRTHAGEFNVVNKHLLRELEALGLCNPNVIGRIVRDNGSVQGIHELDLEVRKLYRTVWEIPQVNLIEMAAERGRFIDQSQSMNLYLEGDNIKISTMNALLMYGWMLGLKTGVYYLKMRSVRNASQVAVRKERVSLDPIDDITDEEYEQFMSGPYDGKTHFLVERLQLEDQCFGCDG